MRQYARRHASDLVRPCNHTASRLTCASSVLAPAATKHGATAFRAAHDTVRLVHNTCLTRKEELPSTAVDLALHLKHSAHTCSGHMPFFDRTWTVPGAMLTSLVTISMDGLPRSHS